ncbi:LRRN4 C-terminal-like protein [Megalops cyprinoides]|uniref:LRRN4 C-terminal-like protein n=1 Tax=Megalops cyprinoides TaxID=118141 RepID=UPI001864AA48|nr:LRRN4 C-terminal-like protein [Megalops cyprinoides]
MPATGIPALLLLIISLVLLSSCLANPITAPQGNNTSTKPPVTRLRILYVTGLGDDDYTDYGDEDSKTTRSSHGPNPTLHGDPEPCDFDPCRDGQVPCAQLSANTGCLCPGVSGAHEPPKAPAVGQVSQEGSEVLVTWCAPLSTVTQYRVQVDGQDPLVFGERARRGTLGPLEAGARVCVEAVNEAGASQPSDRSCLEYKPQDDGSSALKAGVIGGGLGFLLLLSLTALLLWKRNACKKSGGDTEGLGNPSYSSEGTL